MPHPPLRQNSGFSDFMSELHEEDDIHAHAESQRQEAQIESLRTQFRQAVDDSGRRRILGTLIPLIQSTIGRDKLTLVYHDPGQRNPYFEYVPRTHRFFRLDPQGSGSVQEIHFSSNPEREPYVFSKWNADTGLRQSWNQSGQNAMNVQNAYPPLPQRSIGHRLAAIHGFDRDVWIGDVRA